jgi:hypothetical protein
MMTPGERRAASGGRRGPGNGPANCNARMRSLPICFASCAEIRCEKKLLRMRDFIALAASLQKKRYNPRLSPTPESNALKFRGA